MIYNLNKLKLLKKFNLSNLYEFTTKINLTPFKKKILKEYKWTTNIALFKLIYNIKLKRLKFYFNKFLFFNFYNFIKVLKLRLDFILFNFNLFLTITQARQHIAHKHVLLNNKIARQASYCIKENDIIHLINLPTDYIKKVYIFSYIIKKLNTPVLKTNRYKKALLSRGYKLIRTIPNTYDLNSNVCSKNLKIKIHDINNLENKKLYNKIAVFK